MKNQSLGLAHKDPREMPVEDVLKEVRVFLDDEALVKEVEALAKEHKVPQSIALEYWELRREAYGCSRRFKNLSAFTMFKSRIKRSK